MGAPFGLDRNRDRLSVPPDPPEFRALGWGAEIPVTPEEDEAFRELEHRLNLERRRMAGLMGDGGTPKPPIQARREETHTGPATDVMARMTPQRLTPEGKRRDAQELAGDVEATLDGEILKRVSPAAR